MRRKLNQKVNTRAAKATTPRVPISRSGRLRHSESAHLSQNLSVEVVRLEGPPSGGAPGTGAAAGERVVLPQLDTEPESLRTGFGGHLGVEWADLGVDDRLEAGLQRRWQDGPQ